MLDVAGPMDVFHEANNQIGDSKAYEVQTIAMSGDLVAALNGTRFTPNASIDCANGVFDTVLVAGSPGIREFEQHPGLIAWLKRQSQHANRIGSICTGAFLLAHAGLLNGRRATTHWNSTARLSTTFPKIRVDPDPIFIRDGRIYTTAGVSASMDLALALVEEDYGRSLALRIAKELILFIKRPGGQSQFSMQLASQVAEGGPIKAIHEWILSNLSKDLSVEALASKSGMSERNFARLFKRQTQMTPGDFVESARVEAARRMLEENHGSLKMVAAKYGFTNQGGLRRAFVRRLKVTPAEYRATFQSPAPIKLTEINSRYQKSLRKRRVST
jgi:transcriptional regulator GlxA family with amidase domain